MCIICISDKGIRQPNKAELFTMFDNNPHGSGYMFARNGKVEIHKGFMTFDDFMTAIRTEEFTEDDVVIYHFRISTQAGVNPEMCHPFPLSRNIEDTKVLDCRCDAGVAHNGIIHMTSDMGERTYSDTATFVAHYLPYLVRSEADMDSPYVLQMIEELIGSKMVILNRDGHFVTVGNFIEEKSGLLFSNSTYLPYGNFYTSNSKKHSAANLNLYGF